MKPNSFYKVKVPELKEIIEGCIRMNKAERYTIQDLLEHAFFQEDTGVHVELAEEDDGVKSGLKLWLRMDDTKKLHGKYKDNNAIEFLFELHKDVAEQVAQEMVTLGFVCEADYKLVAKAVRDRVATIKRKREKMKRAQDELQRQEQEKQPGLLHLMEELKGPPGLSSAQPSPATPGSGDSAFPPEPEEPEVDQHQHFLYRHTSYSSTTCTQAAPGAGATRVVAGAGMAGAGQHLPGGHPFSLASAAGLEHVRAEAAAPGPLLGMGSRTCSSAELQLQELSRSVSSSSSLSGAGPLGQSELSPVQPSLGSSPSDSDLFSLADTPPVAQPGGLQPLLPVAMPGSPSTAAWSWPSFSMAPSLVPYRLPTSPSFPQTAGPQAGGSLLPTTPPGAGLSTPATPPWSPVTSPLISLAEMFSLAMMSMAHTLLPTVTVAAAPPGGPQAPAPIPRPQALYLGPAHFTSPDPAGLLEPAPCCNGTQDPHSTPAWEPAPAPQSLGRGGTRGSLLSSERAPAAGVLASSSVSPSSPKPGSHLIVSESPAPGPAKARLSPINEETKPQILGRFQVTTSKDPANSQQQSPSDSEQSSPELWEGAAGASLQPSTSSSSSTEGSTSHDSDSVPDTPVQDPEELLAEEGTPVALAESDQEGVGAAGAESPQQAVVSQVWMSYTRSMSYLSSDDTESEDEEIWEELQSLRQKHLSEVQTLQAVQKKEMEELYCRMGKQPPPGIVSPAPMLSSRQRRLSKGGFNPSRRNSLQRLELSQPPGIMRRNSLSGSSTGSQEQRPTRGVTFAGDLSRM
nr:serine/threonine-protein kinase WNK4 [Pelodiscus sinensis]|eukprot:XP_025041726.1 serine/threonine-protein kinase WNK4 [Pelodiscus sinensis]